MYKLSLSNCLDIDMDDLTERLDKAKKICEEQHEAFVTIVVDGANREPYETELMALYRRLGVTFEVINEFDKDTLLKKILSDLQDAVDNFIKSFYDTTGYTLFLQVKQLFGWNIMLMMSKE